MKNNRALPSAKPASQAPAPVRLLPKLVAVALLVVACTAALPQLPAQSQEATVTALPSLNVPAYMGTWYQVAWLPNRFQKQCVSDTSATYRQLPGGQVEINNRCRLEDGSTDSVNGIARPAGSVMRGDQLQPAQLEVSFLPPLLRWLPIWGSYWVLDMAVDGRYAVVSEPTREYMWVLARQPSLPSVDENAIRARLAQFGFRDLSRWQGHRHTKTAPMSVPALSPAPAPATATATANAAVPKNQTR